MGTQSFSSFLCPISLPMSFSVNHVMSTGGLRSTIFDDIYWRFALHPGGRFVHTKSVAPDKNATIRHYYRPHLEWRLLSPAVITVHHDPMESYPWLASKLFLPRWRSADHVVCLNSRQQGFLSENGIVNTSVIPHGVDRQVFAVPKQERAVHSTPIRLGVISKRYDRGVKGEWCLKQLINTLNPRDFAFVLVGEGRSCDASLARARGFEVTCFESLPYHLFAGLYEQLDYLLILSDFEGGPACLPEALGSGVPVIAQPVGMVADYVIHEENGILLDEESWVDQIVRLASDDALRFKVNKGAFRGAASIPDWGEVMQRYADVYRRVLGAGE